MSLGLTRGGDWRDRPRRDRPSLQKNPRALPATAQAETAATRDPGPFPNPAARRTAEGRRLALPRERVCRLPTAYACGREGWCPGRADGGSRRGDRGDIEPPSKLRRREESWVPGGARQRVCRTGLFGSEGVGPRAAKERLPDSGTETATEDGNGRLPPWREGGRRGKRPQRSEGTGRAGPASPARTPPGFRKPLCKRGAGRGGGDSSSGRGGGGRTDASNNAERGRAQPEDARAFCPRAAGHLNAHRDRPRPADAAVPAARAHHRPRAAARRPPTHRRGRLGGDRRHDLRRLGCRGRHDGGRPARFQVGSSTAHTDRHR